MEERGGEGLHLVGPGVGPHRKSELLRREIPVPGALLGDGGQIRGVGEEVLDDRLDRGTELVVFVTWTALLGAVEKLL
jgi:hypothetical protein